MPIKCPVAPLEFAFLADWYFRECGVRKNVELVYSDAARRRLHQAGRIAAPRGLLAEKEIELVTEFNAERWTPSAASSFPTTGGHSTSTCSSPSRSTEAPPSSSAHRGSVTVSASPDDKRTLQSTAKPNVFALGDATDLPISKAGSVTHFEGEVLSENIARYLAGEELDAGLRRTCQLLHRDGLSQGVAHRFQLRDGAASRPLPDAGRPLPLLRESRLNHSES